MSLIFPVADKDFVSGGKPFVQFFAVDPGLEIFLPIPAGVQFADGADYSTIDLGIIGALDTAPGTAFSIDSVADGIKGQVDAVKKSWSENKGEAAAQIAKLALNAGLKWAFGEGAEATSMYATKTIANPNTRTTFQGSSLRRFTFQFTLVGREESDSMAILDIQNAFRKWMYPEGQLATANLAMKYPTIWVISFHEGGKGSPANAWIPIPTTCYLVSMDTNFNPSGHMYRVDGSPTEVSLSLTFQETHTLIRQDIESLAPMGVGGGGGAVPVTRADMAG